MAMQPALNTIPLVELDDAGKGHVPYVRLDARPIVELSQFQKTQLDLLREIYDVLFEMRDEMRAIRLAKQVEIETGDVAQTDFLELARSLRDGAEEF